MSVRPVLRFAPSPNGELHLGHALSALVGYETAQRLGGRFLLRIEDIDRARTRQSFVDAIYRDLAWLGIRWEEPVLIQSEHFDVYRAAAGQLRARNLLYPCFATRTEIESAAQARGGATDPDGAPLYPGLHKRMPPTEVSARVARGEAYALRLDMTRALTEIARSAGGSPTGFAAIEADGGSSRRKIRPELWGDAVIVRKDVPTSYHLSVVVDDAHQGVTHVTRGNDLLPATDLQRVLQILLGLPEPVYHHHRLVTDPLGRKLAKSARDASLRQLREAGATPADIRRLVGLS